MKGSAWITKEKHTGLHGSGIQDQVWEGSLDLVATIAIKPTLFLDLISLPP